MTKKHLILLAELIVESRERFTTEKEEHVIDYFEKELARFGHTFCSNFDADRFHRACNKGE